MSWYEFVEHTKSDDLSECTGVELLAKKRKDKYWDGRPAKGGH